MFVHTGKYNNKLINNYCYKTSGRALQCVEINFGKTIL